MMNYKLIILIVSISIIGCAKNSAQTDNAIVTPPTTTDTGSGSITHGTGTVTNNAIYSCSGGRVTNMGSIISKDNKTWILPGENSFTAGIKLFDLYNESGVFCLLLFLVM
jgi:hypothetical protein